jgi:hypothetical protein
LNHKLRWIAAAALGAALVGAPSAARAAKPAAATAPHSLALSATQKQKLMAMQKKAQAEVDAVQKGKGTEQQKQAKILAIAKKYDALQLTLLTPAQKQRVLQARTVQRRRAQQTAAVAQSLTPAQKKKIEGFRAAFFKKAQAITANKKLTEAQKRSKLSAMQTALGKQVDGVLNAKQKAMVKQIK